FGELFYLPDVERGARADAIEESWFDWQEGNREICPECEGTRLNPVARAVRLHLPLKRSSRREEAHPFRNAIPSPAIRASSRRLLQLMKAKFGRKEMQATIDFFANLPVENACELF